MSLNRKEAIFRDGFYDAGLYARAATIRFTLRVRSRW
jgi:hypothetical protein